LQTEINSIMKLHSVSEEASSSTRNYGTARRNANSADDAGTAGTNSLAQAYKNLYGNSRQALSYTQRLRSEVLSLVTAYFGFYSIIDILKSTVDAYQTLQAAEFRLNAANQGDKSATGQDLDFIRRAADKLGISMGVLADEYSKFAVATIGTILQGDNTRKIFLSVAQAARVLHLSASDTQGVFLALTEIVSKGAVQMEELRRQLGNRLPGALQIMADGLKVSTAELIQMMSQGEITAAALIPFADELNKRFGSTLTDSLSSTQTELGKLSNAIFEALLAFGNAGFLQSFNKLLADLTTMLKDPGFSTFAALMSRVIASLVSGLDFAAQHFQIFVGLISAFIGLKTVPIFVAIAEKVMNLGKVFTVLSGTFTTVVSTERAVAIAMAEAGVAAETTSVGVRGLTAAMRVLTSSTGIGLAITAISFAIGAWATSADDATTALAEHQKIVDDVKNSYDDAKAAAKSWSDVVKSTTQSQAAANLADLQASLQKSRQQVLDPATTFNIYGGAAGGLAGSKNATGTAQSKQQLTDLINLFRSGGINAQAFKNGLEAVGSADETVSKQLIVDLENRADKTAELEKATNEMMAVLTLANKDATDQSKELALETLGLVNKQRQQTEQEIKATAQSQAYATAMETLTTATDSASGALEKLKAAANIESAFKSAVNAARTMGEVAAAIERANSALDALNQKDIASKYAAYGSGGGMDGGASAAFIRDRESFASTPYNDPRTDGQGNQVGGNIYRAGFGSNTITLADGTVQEITQGMRVSVADANRDLIRRIGELQTGLSNTLGADKFNSMTPQQQAALTSIAYNYGSLPKDIADAIKSGMTDAQVADVIRGHGGDNGGINRDRRGMEASMFNSTTNPAIVDEALKKQDAAVQKAAEFNTELAQTLAEQQAQLENQGKITREVAQSKAVEEEVKKAKAAGVVLTKEQIAQISDLAGKIWDQKHADDAANTALAQANALYKERNALQAQLNDARSKGDKGKVDDLGTKLTDVNAQLSDAIDKAEAMWKAIGGDQADVAITKLEALKAQSAKTSNTMYMDFQKVAGMIVDGLGSAFDSFSQQIAQGVAPLVALRDAFLKFASDFLVQIAQMILKQAIFNALNTMLGGTSLGAAIGLAHTGGIVGQSRVGSGNSSRSVSPMVFAGAQRFHGGGFPGLAPGEVPAIVQTGEEILKRNDPRNALNGAAGKGGSGAPAQNKIKIVNLFDTGALLQAALDTEVGQQVLFNFMSDNKAALGGVG
jgi:tape measure domain-containing protein